jgi:hypothetical protein
MSDFSKNQGGVQKRPSTGRDPQNQGGEPTTGFTEAPKTQEAPKGPGPGVGNSRKGIR